MSIRFLVFTLSLFLGSLAPLYAQLQLPPVTTFTPKDYGTEQTPENFDICRDKRGFIYVGNTGGVYEFDGYNWNFIPVATGYAVLAVSSASDNQIAVGGLNFLGVIAPDKTGKMVYRSLSHLLPDTLSKFEVITIESIGAKIFFQTKEAIYEYEKGKVKVHLPEHSFFRGYECSGRYFVRSRQVGLLEYKNGNWITFAKDTISADYGFFGIVDFDKKNFLAITHEHGFYFLDKVTGNLEEAMSFFQMDYGPKVYDVIKLAKNHYALATLNYGVVMLDQNLELLSKIGRFEGLKTSHAKAICTDNSGNIWAATQAGVSLIDIHSPLHFYDETSGLQGNIESVQHIGTNFYAGTSSGMYFLSEAGMVDDKPWIKIDAVNSLVNDLDKNERDVLVASISGLYAGTLNTFYLLEEEHFMSVKYIPGIEKIIGVTSQQIKIYDNTTYKKEREIELPVRLHRSLSISYDTSVSSRTRVWIGTTESQGVLRLDFNKDGSYQLESFTEADGLPKGMVRPFSFLGKPIFLTEIGIQHFIPEEEVMKSLTEEEKQNPEFNRGYFDAFHIPGIKTSGNLSGMVWDNGRLYFCENNRICYFDGQGKKYSREFSTLKMGRVNQIMAIKGNIWICTAEGVARFNPYHLKNINQKFNLYFRKINTRKNQLIMDGYFESNGKFFISQSDRAFQLEYGSNSLEFELASDYFDWNNKLVYSWYLEGTEEPWSNWSRENKIVLNNLHEGDYVLHVKARNVYGIESKEAIFYFTILPPWYRTWWAYVLYGLAAVLIIFLSIRIASYRLKQSNIRLEKTVQERTLEIASKNIELQEQNHQILHQKQEITDSINYARRIQEAILPVKKEIQRVFPESFVLFKPKDIVSGDFYWFAQQDHLSIFICADCTGHGVPGAFMSMICTDRLNHTVLEKKIITPSAMLSEVNQGIKRSLKQDDESNLKTKDGMDAAVCSYNHQTRELKYAGANRPLWLLRAGEIIEYKPTKTAVGGFTPEDQIFEENIIHIQKDDIIYLSTDGYADQFGGPKGKKLMVKAFKELLLTNASLPFDEQQQKLDKYIEDWRTFETVPPQEIEQVDDMCVMGIKF